MQVRGTDFMVYLVQDIEKSIAFFQDDLGMTLTERPIPNWAEFEATPTTLALYQPERGAPGASGNVSIGLAVDNVVTAVEQLKAKGVTVYLEPMETPVCWIATIADPDGNAVTLHQRKDGSFG